MADRNCWTILTPTLLTGTIVGWIDEQNNPVVWDSREEAQFELDADNAEAQEQIRRGERDPEDAGPCADDYVAACVQHEDGSLTIPELNVTWTLADIRQQRGIA